MILLKLLLRIDRRYHSLLLQLCKHNSLPSHLGRQILLLCELQVFLGGLGTASDTKFLCWGTVDAALIGASSGRTQRTVPSLTTPIAEIHRSRSTVTIHVEVVVSCRVGNGRLLVLV